MSLKLIAPDKKIMLTKQQLQVFAVFLDSAKTKCFTGMYAFKNHNRDREELYELILAGFAEKILNKIISNYHQLSTKKIKIPVTQPEEKMLIAGLFVRMYHHDDPYLMAIVETIVSQLKPLKRTQAA